MHISLLLLSLLAFLFALVMAVSARRSRFLGYGEIAKDVERLARVLQAEIFRDGPDLVVRGNYSRLPVLVRFSLAKDSSGLSITLQAPANFQMFVTPVSASQREPGARVRTADGIFDFKFITTSEQPMLARMFVSNAATLQLIKKLCWASFTSLRIDFGKLEYLVRPFQVAHVFDYVQHHLAAMEKMAENLGAMPGAETIQIVPYRKTGNRLLKPAIALGLFIALLEAGRISGVGAAQEPVLASQAVVGQGVLPSDAAGILYLRGWRLAQESDFDSNERGWLRAQGATPGGTVHGDFSGKNNGRDVAYILIGDQGIMRVVLLSQGRLVYDQQYRQILAAIRVPASNLNAIEWRAPLPGKPDGDGLLIITKSDNPGSSLIFTLRDGSLMLSSPTNYQKVAF